MVLLDAVTVMGRENRNGKAVTPHTGWPEGAATRGKYTRFPVLKL